MRSIWWCVLSGTLVIGLSACATQHPARAASSAPIHGLDMGGVPGWHEPQPGLYTAGQPDVDDWRAIARAGVTTVINLRTPEEMAGRDEAAEVRAAGMRYVSLPIAGPDDLSAANAAELWRMLSGSTQPMLVHCASGNRVGALLALGAAQQGAMSAEAALSLGERAGMTRLAPVVRERLGVAPASLDPIRCAAREAGEPDPNC